MRDDPESLLIRREETQARARQMPPRNPWPSSPRAVTPRGRAPSPPLPLPPLPVLGEENPPLLRLPGSLSSSKLKVSTVLNASELLAIQTPEGRQRITLCVSLSDRALSVEISAKSLRRAQRAIREIGPDNTLILLTGNLEGDSIVGAGISAQLKTPKSKQAP